MNTTGRFVLGFNSPTNKPMTTAIETTFEIVPEELGLDLTAKNSLEVAFRGFFATAGEWKAKAEAITEPKAARAARLELKNLRVSAEKTRKTLKEDSLRMGKAIDGANNILLALIVPIEKSLDDIEKAEERRIAAKVEARQQERLELLAPMEHATHGLSLGTMSDDAWETYYQQAKDVYEVRQARERKAREESEALAKKEAEEREAQRLENIRLKADAEKREAELKAEREAAAAAAEVARKEREAAEAVARAEREKIQADAAEAARKAQEAAAKAAAAQAKAEADAKDLRDAEAKRVADEKAAAEAKAKADAAAAKKAAAAPDRAKLMQFAGMVRHLDVPLANSEAGQIVAAEIGAKVESFAKWIEAQAATL